MQKEIVTLENIKKDMLALLCDQIKVGILSFLGLWLIALLIGQIFKLCGRNISFLVIHLVSLSFVLLEIILVLIRLYQIKTERFIFMRDFVVDKISRAPYILGRSTFYPYKPYRLVFARAGKLSIRRNMDFYKWTGCPRSDKTIFDTADLKDDFLLVQIGYRTQVIYNEKFFDINTLIRNV